MTRAEEFEASSNKMRFVEILDAAVLVMVAPTEVELPAILRLLEGMEKIGKDIPVVFVNAKLQSGGSQAGILMAKARKLLTQLTPTFHLEQFEPDSDDPLLNAGVVSRVWPRPYSTWEDNPDDPDATG